MFDTWKIVTNHNERRILVVNGILSEEYKKELRWEDYEAIFIPIRSPTYASGGCCPANPKGYRIGHSSTLVSVHFPLRPAECCAASRCTLPLLCRTAMWDRSALHPAGTSRLLAASLSPQRYRFSVRLPQPCSLYRYHRYLPIHDKDNCSIG